MFPLLILLLGPFLKVASISCAGSPTDDIGHLESLLCSLNANRSDDEITPWQPAPGFGSVGALLDASSCAGQTQALGAHHIDESECKDNAAAGGDDEEEGCVEEGEGEQGGEPDAEIEADDEVPCQKAFI